jgi:hypothetical protein
MAPSSEGDRTVDCSTYDVRTDLIMHRVLTRQSPLRMRIEASVRALVVAVLRGRSAATSALDNLGLLIEEEGLRDVGQNVESLSLGGRPQSEVKANAPLASGTSVYPLQGCGQLVGIGSS